MQVATSPGLLSTRCTASKAFTAAAVCFSENRSIPLPKASIPAAGVTAARIGRLSALAEPAVQRTRPSAMANAAVVIQLQATLERGANESAGGTRAAKLVAGRRDAANVLGVRAWWYKWTCAH